MTLIFSENKQTLLLDVGNGLIRQVEVAQDRHLLVDLGLETFVLFSFEEALRFCYERQYHLGRMLAFTRDRQAQINVFIDKTLTHLDEASLEKKP